MEAETRCSTVILVRTAGCVYETERVRARRKRNEMKGSKLVRYILRDPIENAARMVETNHWKIRTNT